MQPTISVDMAVAGRAWPATAGNLQWKHTPTLPSGDLTDEHVLSEEINGVEMQWHLENAWY